MSALADHLDLLLRFYGVSVRGQLQYRGSFVMSFLASLLVTAIEFLGLWALFARFGPLEGWSLAEAAVLYGLVSASFAVSDVLAGSLERFGTDFVRTGDYDRLLLRPRPSLLQLMGTDFQLRRFGRLAQGLVVLGWGLSVVGGDLGLSGAAVLAFAFLGGVALFVGLLFAHAALGFWTVETLEIGNVLTYGGVQTVQYPLPIYHRYLRRVFTLFVPLACVSYFPVVFALGLTDPLGSTKTLQVLAPLAGFAFLLGTLALWRLGERRYASTGS